MTDHECAAVLRRWLSEHGGQHVNTVVSPMKVKAAIERAIELLDLDWDMVPVEREELRRLVMERRNKP